MKKIKTLIIKVGDIIFQGPKRGGGATIRGNTVFMYVFKLLNS